MTLAAHTSVVVDKTAEDRLVATDFAQLETIFGLLPTVIFYVKDHARLWVTCNKAALTLLRRQSVSEVIGTREEDFFPEAIASAIREDDLLVLRHGEVITERVEIIANEHGELVWAKTSKLPVQNGSGDVIGLVGITQLLDVKSELPPRFEKFRKVVEIIDGSLENTPTVPELAVAANMSESHFRRSFKQCFDIAPQEFILQQRLRHAAKLLTQTDLPVAKIALESGFGDQSHFSRQFGRFFGESPRKYRMIWR